MSDDLSIGAGFDSDPRSEQELNAEGLLSTRQMSILCGIPQSEISAEFRRQRGSTPEGVVFQVRMPRHWIESGLRRRELAATDDLGEALVILAALDELSALPETP